jgi:hypothetical protein
MTTEPNTSKGPTGSAPAPPPRGPSGLRPAVRSVGGGLVGLGVGLGLAATCDGGGAAGLFVLLAATTLPGTRIGAMALWTLTSSETGPDESDR